MNIPPAISWGYVHFGEKVTHLQRHWQELQAVCQHIRSIVVGRTTIGVFLALKDYFVN